MLEAQVHVNIIGIIFQVTTCFIVLILPSLSLYNRFMTPTSRRELDEYVNTPLRLLKCQLLLKIASINYRKLFRSNFNNIILVQIK
jgi:CRISPR/Cas system endoribonuclease Cas6 (RAMP superfamily)